MIRRPNYLDGPAADLWTAHTSRLEREGKLTAENLQSWIVLCEIWGQLRTLNPDTDSKVAIRYNSLLKQFPSYAVQFGLFSRKATPKQTDDRDELGL